MVIVYYIHRLRSICVSNNKQGTLKVSRLNFRIIGVGNFLNTSIYDMEQCLNLIKNFLLKACMGFQSRWSIRTKSLPCGYANSTHTLQLLPSKVASSAQGRQRCLSIVYELRRCISVAYESAERKIPSKVWIRRYSGFQPGWAHPSADNLKNDMYHL